MPEDNGWRRLAQKWMAHAEGDLQVVRLAAAGSPIRDPVLGFHAQQAMEKAFKAALAARMLRPPRTHDLASLAKRVRETYGLSEDPLFGDDLTDWATVLRYPGGDAPAPLDRRRILKQVQACIRLVESLVK